MKTLYHNIGLASLLFFFTLTLPGCSDNSAPAKVTGKVTLDDKPIANATVTFTPDNGGRISQAMTDYEGRYELRFTAQLKGAVVGTHRVTIQTGSLEPSAGSESPDRPETIPKKYNAASELTETLKSGKNVVNFELTTN